MTRSSLKDSLVIECVTVGVGGAKPPTIPALRNRAWITLVGKSTYHAVDGS
jgi:hypothetical protein